MTNSLPQPCTLGAVVYPDFELLDLYGPLEMFGALSPHVRIVTVAERPGPVKSHQGPQALAEHGFDDAPRLDLLLLPGGIGTLRELENPALLDFLRARAPEALVTMSVCTGSAILAKAGLLDGRRATSNKQVFALAVAQSDRVQWVERARWVDEGAFVTSSGVSAGTDMALGVIARLWGQARAQQIAEFTEYDWQSDPDQDAFHHLLNASMGRLAAGG
jgi:putative intracellular protease/amidase